MCICCCRRDSTHRCTLRASCTRAISVESMLHEVMQCMPHSAVMNVISTKNALGVLSDSLRGVLAERPF